MRRALCGALIGCTWAVWLSVTAPAARAEAVFDGTVGPNAPGTTLSGDFVVTENDGEVAGANLFHSFETFNVGDTESATFTTNGSVENIIARVTGDGPIHRSDIAGPVDVAPGVDFHLLNPNGILLSSGAELDVSGSVFLTTADAMGLHDGVSVPDLFTVADVTPTLSSQSPSAFLFDVGATGRIDVEGDALTGSNRVFQFGEGGRPSFIASDVRFDRAFVGAEAGLIRVAAVGSEGADVPLDLAGWSPTSAGVSGGEVRLSEFSFLCADRGLCVQGGDPTRAGRGRVVVRGGRLVLADSAIIAGGDGVDPIAIDVDVTGDVSLSGFSSALWAGGFGAEPVGGIAVSAGSIDIRDSNFGIRIESEQSSAPLTLTARTIALDGGSPIVALTRGDGDSASVLIEADDIHVAGESAIGVQTDADGGAGSVIDGRRVGVHVEAETLRLTTGGQISSSTDGAGESGDVIVDLRGDLVVDGAGATSPSGLFARSGSDPGTNAGNGGVIDVKARSMHVRGGAEISAQTNGTGDAGSIVLDLEQGLVVEGVGSLINAGGHRGDGGDIEIAANSVVVADGGQIGTDAPFEGDAGGIDIVADDGIEIAGGAILSRLRGVGLSTSGGDIDLSAGTAIRLRNGGVISTEGASTETAGSITMKTPGLVSITGGSVVSARATRSGDAGSVSVRAGQFELVSSAITTESLESAGGQIIVSSQTATDLTDSRIEASVLVTGDGSGGDVELSGERILVNRSQLLALAEDGLGGDLTLTADAVLISADSVLDATSETNVDGQIVVNSPDTNLTERLGRLPEEPLDSASLFAARCASRDPGAVSSFVVGGRDGTPWLPDAWLPPPMRGVGAEPRAPALAALRSGDLATAAAQFDREAMASTRDEDFVAARLAAASALEAVGALGAAEQRRLEAQSRAEEAGLERWAALARADRALALAAWDVQGDAGGELDAARAVLARVGSPLDRARVAHQAGLVHTIGGRSADALAAFEEAATIAAGEGDAEGAGLAAARAWAAAARLAVDASDLARAEALLHEASAAALKLPTSRALAETRIHIGESWRRLAPRVDATSRAYTQLVAAKNEAEATGDDRTGAAAWMALARLYRDDGRLEEALDLARVASGDADAAGARELLYAAERLVGQLLAQLGQLDQAITAHARALVELEALRFERSAPGWRYRTDVAGAYYELADLQLGQASGAQDATERDVRLRGVRATIEASKAAELRDFFRDACVDELASMQRSIDDVSTGALIVYPIAFDDRLVLLVSTPGEPLRQLVVDVSGAAFEDEVRRFRRLVTKISTRQYLRPARRLYDWLVRPLEPLLEEAGLDTLVFVPDGSLRTIPIAALHDGERFVVERFALAVSPSIELTRPRPLGGSDVTVLLAGVSEARSGFAPLEFVPDEIDALHTLMGGEVLLDATFTDSSFEESVRAHDYDVVHLATHAQFGADARDSLLLAHDGPVSIDRLRSIIARFRHRDEPLELLTLSACETAAGDDRAALGLSGIAVRAGARSVLGSLWVVDDAVASELMIAFYTALQQPGTTRAEALRRAQLGVLEGQIRAHPFYWAPFVLINSWL